MILDIASAKASWSDNKLHVAFDVIPEERFHAPNRLFEPPFSVNSTIALSDQSAKPILPVLMHTFGVNLSRMEGRGVKNRPPDS